MDNSEFQILIAKYMANKCTQEEEQLLLEFFDTYKAEDDAWDFQGLGDRADFDQHLYRDIYKNIGANGAQTRLDKNLWLSQSFKYAAIIVMLIIASATFYLVQIGSRESQKVVWGQKQTKSGEKKSIMLSDGTKVKMNANTSLQFPATFEKGQRVVVLEGEAFFEVTKDSKRPFIIQTGDITTTVLGTSFNITAYAKSDKIEVSVLTGKVKVENLIKTDRGISDVVYLNPNRKATYMKGQDQLIVSSFETEETLGWKDGIIFFKKARESEVVEKLTAWYGVSFSIQNQSPEPWDLTAKFENQSLEEVLTSLSYTAKFEYSMTGKVVTIKYSEL